MTMTVAVDAANTLGECVLWCERTGRVVWTDIVAAMLWTHVPAAGITQRWPMPEPVASFALTADDDVLLLGLASGLARYRFSTAAVTRIVDVEAHLPSTRLNDGRCDRQGRFVFGTFNSASDPRHPIGSFYRLNLDLTLERLPLQHASIANSICFSRDGATMYYCDSQERVIRCCDYGDTLARDRVFADLRGDPGEPDGSTIDADDHLWSAYWGKGCIVRYRPDGSVEQTVTLAAPQPTCVAFGGADFDVLYATSARQWLSPAQLDAAPAFGALFSRKMAVRGLPEARFMGA
ncbi:MAG: SMP-30/gluconolactonase/LRE family protein [Pseudomonadota bacterium]|nr:SMP-30/gluconolactonase/LRE family protein [Pseudomonadota bacterium]